jgi:hypothetical protein
MPLAVTGGDGNVGDATATVQKSAFGCQPVIQSHIAMIRNHKNPGVLQYTGFPESADHLPDAGINMGAD